MNRYPSSLVNGDPSSYSISYYKALLAIALAVCPLLPSPVRGAEADDVVAVYASVTPGYKRARAEDGKFKPETYAFGEGGLQGGAQADASIDKLKFLEVAKAVAPALAAQAFVPADPKTPRQTNLLIIVYWGATIGTDNTSSSGAYQTAQALMAPPPPPPTPPPDGTGGTAMTSDPNCSGRREEGEIQLAERLAADSALQQSVMLMNLANRQRDHQNAENAAILGFAPELKRTETFTAPALSHRRQDVLDEVEESRYYVVLKAYDFQAIWLHKEKKLLWETRFSIRERRHDFTKELPVMADSASHYFGQNSGGLVRAAPAAGHVEIGELKSLGPVH